jgi:hypothetical protein
MAYGPDMGFQLGPEFLRKPPKGWLPGRAHALDFVAKDRLNPDGGGAGDSLFDVRILDVLWRVQPESGGGYEFREERRAPMWVKRGGAAGKRSFTLRARPSYGLQSEVAVPCWVNPEQPHDIWVDWDAAHDLHLPVWERMARVEREVSRQRGGVDAIIDRMSNPFADRVRAEDAEYVEQARAADHRQEAAFQAEVDAAQNTPEQVELKRRMAIETRIGESGREATATVVALTDTGRVLEGLIPVFDLVLDVDDEGTIRQVVYEHAWGPRHAKRYKVGKQITVRIDPEDPNRVALMS